GGGGEGAGGGVGGVGMEAGGKWGGGEGGGGVGGVGGESAAFGGAESGLEGLGTLRCRTGSIFARRGLGLSARPAFEDEAVQAEAGVWGRQPPADGTGGSRHPWKPGLQCPDRRVVPKVLMKVDQVGNQIVQKVPR